MIRKIITTEDQSKTIMIEGTNDTYHSIHGAFTEANHIFIENGIKDKTIDNQINIFELGLGTGLNAILSLKEAEGKKINIIYHSIEKFPLIKSEINQMNYESFVPKELQKYYQKIHESNWNEEVQISPFFKIKKIKNDIIDYILPLEYYNFIFFDAFGPKSQPELWQKNILTKMYQSLKNDSRLITYCAQGQFKRDLKSVGFNVENRKGPPGKREITLGFKL